MRLQWRPKSRKSCLVSFRKSLIRQALTGADCIQAGGKESVSSMSASKSIFSVLPPFPDFPQTPKAGDPTHTVAQVVALIGRERLGLWSGERWRNSGKTPCLFFMMIPSDPRPVKHPAAIHSLSEDLVLRPCPFPDSSHARHAECPRRGVPALSPVRRTGTESSCVYEVALSSRCQALPRAIAVSEPAPELSP